MQNNINGNYIYLSVLIMLLSFNYVTSVISLHYIMHGILRDRDKTRDERRSANLLKMLIVPVVHGPAEFARFSTMADSSPI